MLRKITPEQDEYAIGGHGGLKKGKSAPVYPRVRLDLKHLPEAKNMKLGDEVHLHVHGKLSGLSQGRFDNSAEIEMHHVGLKKGKLKKHGDNEVGEAPDDEEAEGEV